jgi:hypothetical protein
MKVGRTSAALASLSLLVAGACVGSAFAHGTSTKRASGAVPGISLPSVTATVPLVGVSVATPSVSVGVPAVTAPVPAVSVSVPAVSATVPAVAVTTPVAAVGVTTQSVKVSTPPVSATTPAVTSVAAQATKTVVAVAATAPKATTGAPKVTKGASAKAGVTTTSVRAEIAVPATRAARAWRLRLARHRRHAVRVPRTSRPPTRTTPATSTTRVASTPSVTSTPTLAATPPPVATPIISGPGDGASLVLTTPVTSAGLPVVPFLPIVAAANAAPRRLLLSSGPGASSYRLDAVPFTAPLLTGGFNGKSRFVASLLPQLSLASVVRTAAPAAAASGPSAGALGGRSPVAPAAGGRGIGVDTPIGRIGISGDGYQFGHWRYPLASVGGIATTVLISLAALAAISALFGGVSAGAAIVRRRQFGASSSAVADPTGGPVSDEDWDL